MEIEQIYLDHAAATPIDERVLVAMMPYFSVDFFNPSSPYLPAIKVRRDFEDAKRILANIIGAKSGSIVMTAGATESINLAFSGVDGHVITTSIEHPAVLSVAKLHENTIVDVDSGGFVLASDIEKVIRPDTVLISVALANNELGTIQPLKEISMIVEKHRIQRLVDGNKKPIYLHCDASQGVGLIDINAGRLGVDMMTLNSAKIYGPKQVGLLWTANHVRLKPFIFGGGQERGLRSGTENVAGAIGFAKALQLADDHRKYESERLEKLRDYMQNTLVNNFPEAVISGCEKQRLASFLHISFPGLDGERLLFLLERQGVLVATGSACAANKGTRSHVLTAIGLSPEVADGSIRITLGHLSNEDNIKKAVDIIVDEVKNEYERVKK